MRSRLGFRLANNGRPCNHSLINPVSLGESITQPHHHLLNSTSPLLTVTWSHGSPSISSSSSNNSGEAGLCEPESLPELVSVSPTRFGLCPSPSLAIEIVMISKTKTHHGCITGFLRRLPPRKNCAKFGARKVFEAAAFLAHVSPASN